MEFPIRAYTVEGRLAGSYVYFLCCAGDSRDTVYIKIGISDTPSRRMLTLVNNCALRALTFGSVNVRSRKIALRIENMLHRAFKANRTQGEWFRFAKDERDRFNAIRHMILEPHRSAMWPMHVTVSAVLPIVRDAHRKQYLYARPIRRTQLHASNTHAI